MTAQSSLEPPFSPAVYRRLGVLAIVLTAATFWVDLVEPLSFTTPIMYLPVLPMAMFWRGRRGIVIACLVIILLTGVGYLVSPPGNAVAAVHNRILVIVALLVSAGFCWWVEGVRAAHARDQERLVAVAKVTNDAIWDWNLMTQDMWWSDGYKRLFQEDPPPTSHRWHEGVEPADRERVTRSIQAAVDLGQDSWRGEYRYHRADNSYRDLIDRGFIIRDSQGKGVRIVGGITDVTMIRQAQRELNQAYEQLQGLAKQYQALVEQSIAGIFTIQDGRLVYANPRLAEMSGLGSADLLSQASIVDAIVQEDRAKVIEALWRRQAGEALDAPYAVRWKSSDGSVKWVEVFGTRVEYHGAPAVMGIAVDVTARKEAEGKQRQLFDELLQTQQRLQTLSRQLLQIQEDERRQLARDLHDEIGQALTALKMTLRRVPRPSEPGVTSGEASALDQGLEIVASLAARIRGISLDLRPAMLDDLGLPETLRWFVTRQAERVGLTVEVTVQDELKGLPASLALVCFRIVQEAVTNVVRHAQATQVEVRGEREGTLVRLLVRDDGIGFDVVSMRGRASRGECIGLLSMEERARAVGGEVGFESLLGKGTEVTATLPIRSLP